jgi:hypothetical protein
VIILPDHANQPRHSGQYSALFGATDIMMASLVQRYLDNIQRSTRPSAHKQGNLEIDVSPKKWERTRWIDGTLSEQEFGDILRYDCCLDSPDWPRRSVAETIAARHADFVELVDRLALTDHLWSLRIDDNGRDAPTSERNHA